ncbi:MarR family transcriptional regulator [Sulfurimicrobium lacus]|uniref:MarR family transcriptional regulator n=1 Tax=Sulfurimicrobium lacus TaxID=2715678 RepID=A0A6F8VA17_9PROT|nr:MarR family transcriptional regulator [Sulfurimicrobium lacus]BCB26504.1 MarR family transcriptional regulator [Sulfurimicrobium lacus]
MKKTTLGKRDFETLSHFRYQLRRFLRFSEEITLEHGVTHLQYLLLLHIKGYQGREWATVGELAERLQSHHHGVVSLVSRCEKLGLVYREKGKVDRREVEVHLTPAGENVVEELARLHRDELLNLQGIFQVPGVLDLAKDDASEQAPAAKPD